MAATTFQSGVKAKGAKLRHYAGPRAETTQQCSKTQPSGLRLPAMQVYVLSPRNTQLLNQDPIFGNPTK